MGQIFGFSSIINFNAMLLVLVLGSLLMSSAIVEGKFKNLFCTLYDKEYGEFISCRIKAINRYRNSINIFYRQLYPAENAVVSFHNCIQNSKYHG